MYTEGFEQWMKMSKNMNVPLGDFGRAMTDICRRFAQQNAEMLSDNFELWTDQLKRLSSVRRPEDFLALQKDIINEDVSASIQCMQKCIHSTVEAIEECNKLFSSAGAHETSYYHPGKAEKVERHEKAERERERR
jgi:hypothetical protein